MCGILTECLTICIRMNPMGKMEDRMMKGLKDGMGKMGKKSPVKEIDPALKDFADKIIREFMSMDE